MAAAAAGGARRGGAAGGAGGPGGGGGGGGSAGAPGAMRALEREDSRERADATLSRIASSMVASDTRDSLLSRGTAAQSGLPHLAVCVVGNHMHGKSALAGSMVADRDGRVPGARMVDASSRHASMAAQMAANRQEREAQYTIDGTYKQLVSEKFDMTVFDAPGARLFFNRTVCMMSMCDAAVIAVSAVHGETEAACERSSYNGSAYGQGGMLWDLFSMAWYLGLKTLVIAVTKLDVPTSGAIGSLPGGAFLERRYKEVRDNMVTPLLRKTGWMSSSSNASDRQVIFVPACAANGANIQPGSLSESTPWYDGPSVVEALDMATPPVLGTTIAPENPVRLPIFESFQSLGARIVVGRLRSGTVRVGDGLSLPLHLSEEEIEALRVSERQEGRWPRRRPTSSIRFVVKGIQRFGADCEEAIAGDFVGLQLKYVAEGLTARQMAKVCCRGAVLGPGGDKFMSMMCLRLRAQVLNQRMERIRGDKECHLHCGTAHVTCKIVRVNKIVPLDGITVELRKEVSALGRCILSDHHEVIGGAVVERVQQLDWRTGEVVSLQGPRVDRGPGEARRPPERPLRIVANGGGAPAAARARAGDDGADGAAGGAGGAAHSGGGGDPEEGPEDTTGEGDAAAIDLLLKASQGAATMAHELRQLAVAEAVARGHVLHLGGGGDAGKAPDAGPAAAPRSPVSEASSEEQQPV